MYARLAVLLLGALPLSAFAAGQPDLGSLPAVPVLGKSTLTVTCHTGLLPDRTEVARFLGGPGSFVVEAARDDLVRQAHHACNQGYAAVRFVYSDGNPVALRRVEMQAIAQRESR